MKKTRFALFQSVICLMLCFSMLVGTTFAWFTDTVTSNQNVIAAGSLDVELEYWTGSAWAPVTEQTNVFEENTLWEPGHTEVVYLRLSNAGSLALNYRFGINIVSEQGSVNQAGEAFKLSQFLRFGTVESTTQALYATREQAKSALTENFPLTDAYTDEDPLYPVDNAAGLPTEKFVTLVVYMPEDVGNAANYATGATVPKINLGLQLVATQQPYEQDSFNGNYDKDSEMPAFPFPVGGIADSATGSVTVQDGKVAESVTLRGSQSSATIPEGVQLENGAQEVTLTVNSMSQTGSNLQLEENQAMTSLNVHVSGVATNNTVPMVIQLVGVLPVGLNIGNYSLYHVENGATKPMTAVATAADVVAHNDFYYDPATGNVTVAMKSFSEIAAVSNQDNAWKGIFDYSWYDANATELTIANADQLAAFGAIVGGMKKVAGRADNKYTYVDEVIQDSFEGKTIKLIADINLGDKESENNPNLIFYPIGYYNSEGTYERTNTAITSGLRNFEGTFDGNGHTIANFYHNTWEMKGDHNWYSPEEQYYRDGMGLFGRVYGGTVKNLTVKNFSSDGEIATTGVIAAYADGATFENIAIFNCNPRVYNIGNGGIVGCVGWYAKEAMKTTFKNITVDNSNKISALWGSYDVACGGIVGQYYPTSGQTSAGTPKNAGIHFENCHISAVMDVYNDVCANYQYYAYRYTGMLIGSVRENVTIDGKSYPKMDGITAKDCTVHFGTWNDYYYCEIIDNTTASYTHDYQMSRLTQIDEAPDMTKMTVKINGKEVEIPETGRANYVVVNGKHATENATCYHFLNSQVWTHDMGGYHDGKNGEKYIDENNDSKADLKEDKQHIYLEFNNLVTGYGWGVTSKGLSDFQGTIILDTVYNGELVDKFKKNETLDGDFLYRVGNGNAFPIGKLFQAIGNQYPIVDSGVYVTVRSLVDSVDFVGTFVTKENWENSTLHITGGTGPAELTIQDYNNCKEFKLIVEVVDAQNHYSEGMASLSADTVLLCNVKLNGDNCNISNCTLYGNGFTFDITNGAHNSGTNTNYSIIGLRSANLDNIKIVGAVYQSYGVMANDDYSAAAIGTSGACKISNSYVSNCLSPVKALSGTLTLENSTLHGGRFCNLDIRGAHVILDGVTTVNTSAGGEKTPDGSVLGMGIVVYYQNSDNAKITIGENGLTQHNWLYIEGTDTTTGDYQYFKATGLSNAFDMMFNIKNKYTVDGKTYVNTGIVSLNKEVDENNIAIPDGYVKENVTYSSYDGYLWTPGSYNVDTRGYEEYVATTQGDFEPEFQWNHPENEYAVDGNQISISFNEGESYTFNTTLPTAIKSNTKLPITVKKDGVVCGHAVTFIESGEHVFTFEYSDPFRYNKDGSVAGSKTYTQTLYVTVSAIDVGVPAPTFTFVVQDNGGTYTGQAGSADGDVNGGIKTVEKDGQLWIMPNVNSADVTAFGSSSTGNTGSIGVINGIYFPIIDGAITYTNGSMFSKGTITRHYPFYGLGDTNGSITIEDDVTYTDNNPSTNLLFYSEYDGTQGVGVGSADDFGLAQGATSSGVSCTTCKKWGISSGAISGGTSSNYGNNINCIYYAKFSYTAANEQTYYYYVGFAFSQQTKAAQGGSCFAEGTLITLADSTQKEIQDVRVGDEVIAWNFYTGAYEVVPVSLLQAHSTGVQNVLHLYFEDGTELKILGEHGVYDADLDTFVFVDEFDVEAYIGHNFVKQDGDGFTTVKLVGYEVTTENTTAYTILSYGHYNVLAEGMFTVTPAHVGENFFNPFDVGEDMKYDEAVVQADIEKYGLYTYEEFAHVLTYEQFVALKIDHFKVSVGKGYITYDGLIYLIENFVNNEDFNVT